MQTIPLASPGRGKCQKGPLQLAAGSPSAREVAGGEGGEDRSCLGCDLFGGECLLRGASENSPPEQGSCSTDPAAGWSGLRPQPCLPATSIGPGSCSWHLSGDEGPPYKANHHHLPEIETQHPNSPSRDRQHHSILTRDGGCGPRPRGGGLPSLRSARTASKMLRCPGTPWRLSP